MNIASAQYVASEVYGQTVNVCIKAVIGSETWHVPLDPANRHYAEIMRQVEAGELTIVDAD